MKHFLILLAVVCPFQSVATAQYEYWLCGFYNDGMRIGQLKLDFTDGGGTALLESKTSSMESAKGQAMKSGRDFKMVLTASESGTQESYECSYEGPTPYSILFRCSNGHAAKCRQLR